MWGLGEGNSQILKWLYHFTSHQQCLRFALVTFSPTLVFLLSVFFIFLFFFHLFLLVECIFYNRYSSGSEVFLYAFRVDFKLSILQITFYTKLFITFKLFMIAQIVVECLFKLSYKV